MWTSWATGTGFLGGFTGNRSVPHGSPRKLALDRPLALDVWNGRDGRASGAVWLNNGIPDDADGTFNPNAVTVRVFRPLNGVFTRLAFVYWIGDWPYATVRQAHFSPRDQYGPGDWQWF